MSSLTNMQRCHRIIGGIWSLIYFLRQDKEAFTQNQKTKVTASWVDNWHFSFCSLDVTILSHFSLLSNLAERVKTSTVMLILLQILEMAIFNLLKCLLCANNFAKCFKLIIFVFNFGSKYLNITLVISLKLLCKCVSLHSVLGINN